jgi:hypothetical protein
VKDGYIKQELAKIKGNYKTIYRLDNRGKSYIKDNVSEIDKLYKFASAEHDYRLAELYFSDYWGYRDSWKTEQDYKQDNHHGTPDATVSIFGVVTIIEVVTQNYTSENIESKEEFARDNGMEVKFYNA